MTPPITSTSALILCLEDVTRLSPTDLTKIDTAAQETTNSLLIVLRCEQLVQIAKEGKQPKYWNSIQQLVSRIYVVAAGRLQHKKNGDPRVKVDLVFETFCGYNPWLFEGGILLGWPEGI